MIGKTQNKRVRRNLQTESKTTPKLKYKLLIC